MPGKGLRRHAPLSAVGIIGNRDGLRVQTVQARIRGQRILRARLIHITGKGARSPDIAVEGIPAQTLSRRQTDLPRRAVIINHRCFRLAAPVAGIAGERQLLFVNRIEGNVRRSNGIGSQLRRGIFVRMPSHKFPVLLRGRGRQVHLRVLLHKHGSLRGGGAAVSRIVVGDKGRSHDVVPIVVKLRHKPRTLIGFRRPQRNIDAPRFTVKFCTIKMHIHSDSSITLDECRWCCPQHLYAFQTAAKVKCATSYLCYGRRNLYAGKGCTLQKCSESYFFQCFRQLYTFEVASICKATRQQPCYTVFYFQADYPIKPFRSSVSLCPPGHTRV